MEIPDAILSAARPAGIELRQYVWRAGCAPITKVTSIRSPWVRRYLPCGICVSRPQGGFLMWIEFPETFDTLRLNSLLRQSGIQIASGALFSASDKYRNCMRGHYGLPLTDEMQQMLRVIGEQAEHLLHEDTLSGH